MTDLATLGFDDQRPPEAFHVPPGDCPEKLARGAT